jgi:hypothetical protein
MKPLQEQIADIIGAPPVTSMDGAAAVMKLIREKQEHDGCAVEAWWKRQPVMGLKYGRLPPS